MGLKQKFLTAIAICCSCLSLNTTQAFVINFEAADFGLTPIFSNSQTFNFTIDIDAPLTAGTTYTNPTLNSVDYRVFGFLAATPSGFPAFDLSRSITGTDFYAQGSSMSFEISAFADLTDGLQVSELVGTGVVFEFNAREVGNGRYHPPIVQLNTDGTGIIQNSNNFGGINPATLQVVDVDFGEEYITALTFNTSTLTIADAPPVSSPAFGFPALILGLIGVAVVRRRCTRLT
ncbi:MAG: hypothetical protein CMM52_10840 [Rhodospirillaceae bacterium]|nr:hypothetical protein [Rhodospirillaceae bacterium]|tara:strand:- start:8987 stop:9685 length:699 start_codon:yes stop_codon:yes gene_type:complete